MICLTDLFRTCADLWNDTLPDDTAVDSESMLALLLGETQKDRDSVIHHSIKGRFSIRQGRWKLELCTGSGGWSSPRDPKALEQGLPAIQLYDMEADVSETENLVEQHPDLVARLLAEVQHSVEQGRSTPGAPQRNDVEIDLLKGAELPKCRRARRFRPSEHDVWIFQRPEDLKPLTT